MQVLAHLALQVWNLQACPALRTCHTNAAGACRWGSLGPQGFPSSSCLAWGTSLPGFKAPSPVGCPWDLTFLFCEMGMYVSPPFTKFL